MFFAVCYGVLRPAYDYFYEPFGLTTDEMGLSEISIVGHTAGYAAALLVLLTSAVVIGWLGFRLGRGVALAVQGARWMKRVVSRINNFVDAHLKRHPVRTGIVLVLTLLLLGAFAAYSIFSNLQRLQTNTIGSGNAGEAITLTIALAFGGFFLGYFSVDVLDLTRLTNGARTLLYSLEYAAAAAVLIATATWSVDFWGASQRAGLDLVAGRDPGSDSYVLSYLSINRSPAQILPTGDSDPLRLCDGKKVPYLLGNGGGSNFVLIFAAGDSKAGGSVIRVPQDLYTVASGLSDAAPCVMPGDASGVPLSETSTP
ncbi:hypothetical protein [Geodermatophilus siccatus]|uniref:hypothetical protein n=1 Tax=Geodermatophilus siccatus TaxID=1137991 RepID=UPI00111412C5|nr:hypothetical protein [Geodermatophilus siccatus]